MSENEQKGPGGRPKLPTICPTCGRVGGYVEIERHLFSCENNQNPQLITQREWRKDYVDREYACPLKCGEWHSYSGMHKHLPQCPKQSEILPYTPARWRMELIQSRTQPGALKAAAHYKRAKKKELRYPKVKAARKAPAA